MYGFLAMLRAKESSFLSGEIRLAEQVANQCAIGIRQAQLYQESQKQVIKLQELNQLKEDFIHTVSHELRTPLTSMKMALTLLGIHKNNPERVQAYLDILTSEWNRELALVNELLELQAIESGTRVYSLDLLDIQTWIPEIVQSFELRCVEHSQIFRLDLDPEINTWVTDQHLLGRILLELLNNACKYTPPEHSITLTLQHIQTGIQIEVTNTGVTITPEHQTKIFEKFHRLPDLDVFNQGGTGLGLSLVKKVVELLGGEITLHSADNITTFRIQLPDLAKDPGDPMDVAVSPLSA
jgi:signal transduction histidine kinase